MSPLVLLTGANGYLGIAVAIGLLAKNYRVRAAIRRQAAVDDMLEIPVLKEAQGKGQLLFVIVPDYSANGALNDAAVGCVAILHLASPLFTTPGDLVPDAMAGLTAALKAAEVNTSVRRLVHTQSYMSTVSFADQLATSVVSKLSVEGRWNDVPMKTAADVVPNEPATKDSDSPIQRYTASKIATRNAMMEYASTHPDRTFSIVNLLPGIIIGPDIRAKTKADFFNSTNSQIGFLQLDYPTNPFYGLPPDVPAPMMGMAIHLQDCVDAHVEALDEHKVPERLANFLLITEPQHGIVWNDAIDIVKKNLPGVAAQLTFPGQIGTIPVKFDSSDTERVLLGRSTRSYEDTVTDTMKWWDTLQ